MLMATHDLRLAANEVIQERDEAKDRLAKDEDALDHVWPVLVRGKLAGRRVVLIQTGDYADANMRLFDQALSKAHARYPALQVYAWSDVVADAWFQHDGIHYSKDGAAYRAALIPAALAEAFPAS